MSFDEYINTLKDKEIAVVGFGVSNKPLVGLLSSYGCNFTVYDIREEAALGEDFMKYKALGVRFVLGEDYLDNIKADVIFRTPGILPSAFDGTDACITSEMEAFFALCPCKIVAVTGSDGKTTTSSLIAAIAQEAGYTVHLGGNIGRPLLCEVDSMGKNDIAVLELSSFQLHSMKCKPDIAVVTNISPNHLDVHPSFVDYIDAKKNIFANQTHDCRLVLNADNSFTSSFKGLAKGEVLLFSMKDDKRADYTFSSGAIYHNGEKIVDASEILLRGEHNIANLMAAFASTEGLASKSHQAKIARTFAGVEHRLELVCKANGISFYNDSIATSPTRAIAALKAFDKPVILIAGGRDKKSPYNEFAKEILANVKALFLTGEAAFKIKSEVDAVKEAEEIQIFMIDDFASCVKAAAGYAKNGDIVLLSPACSSYDHFENFAVRGNYYKEIVKEI